MICLRYVIVNTLHKGDNKDNNNNNNKLIENAPLYMTLSNVSRKTCAKQEEWMFTQTHLNRRKEMGLELGKEERHAPVETSHESTESTTHNWQNEI